MNWRDVGNFIADAIQENGWTVRVTSYPRIGISEERVPLAIVSPVGVQYVEEARGIVRQINTFQVTIYLGDKADNEISAVDEACRKAMTIYRAIGESEFWLESMPEVEVPDRSERQMIPGDVAWITVRICVGLIKETDL